MRVDLRDPSRYTLIIGGDNCVLEGDILDVSLLLLSEASSGELSISDVYSKRQLGFRHSICVQYY